MLAFDWLWSGEEFHLKRIKKISQLTPHVLKIDYELMKYFWSQINECLHLPIPKWIKELDWWEIELIQKIFGRELFKKLGYIYFESREAFESSFRDKLETNYDEIADKIIGEPNYFS